MIKAKISYNPKEDKCIVGEVLKQFSVDKYRLKFISRPVNGELRTIAYINPKIKGIK
ncbi:hypothetical protein [Veillonella criceti]|uniref:Uncharacterized protein n=1 Tax=Veillonella criceti TaxID=103891 RepID=A0A380NLY7_9FIRM|nr:hypothetical protein [Veillonella criceti]SUP44369.1 Uncharacterised protein [Veillonella criceti]SUP79490.1 Uncharacterised protein [Veillonella criceti]